ncbi:hypothetical protein LPJ59_001506 [Coemansia sp. RSA 2399]|nr:hypothetical protein LPJ59_001506 [Coemansia sp. RSA 2399]KAJ1906755.1 hypothetical protein LPJ81_001170 [Coemansia sp. IMI 209127]
MKFGSALIISTLGPLALLAVMIPGAGAATTITLDQLNNAIPDRVGSSSCATSECATNTQALSSINKAIAAYGVTQMGEITALISLMAYESGDWLYNINHYPGRAGQGTRAMLMYSFVSEYANQLHPADATKVLAAGAVTDAVENNVRALVLNDDDSFGSAFWYLVNHAAAYHGNDSHLRVGNFADFKDYVTNGVGAGWDDSRQTVWERVNSALNG